MGRSFDYVILGGGVAAGYAALEFTKKGVSHGELCIISDEPALKLEEIGINGSNAENVCYLRDLDDATKLVNTMRTCNGGNAIVIGGGYIGMECAASLVINKINVSMVSGANLKDGRYLPVDMVVVGIGARPNTNLFENQLTFENGGIKVNSRLQSSNTSVYAVGDVASFPIKLFGDTHRLEHVDAARKSARHAVSAIMEPNNTTEFDYLPFFYSRVFSLSWQFYGDNAGEVVHFGDFSGTRFGAYWVNNGRLVGCFLEGGDKEDYDAIANVIRVKPAVADLGELERRGVEFAVGVSQKLPVATVVHGGGLYASFGIVVAASVALFAYWYVRKWS
ncbi:FAD-dependent pyridine nucleotide-disulfide oxidoreductase [Cynara cardunculus var. scolymus]|uniref:monodehydroascorbate reductase (NADH) n=1 Tax=Cynara cardunculus var. scolymus TaxID=59895 RepID=A0A103Y4U3_CYNCS|nr:FAD-dependent pyridine nucleotide-disulfide oxidoreductase [Cynara cardunculus var. scolymus]